MTIEGVIIIVDSHSQIYVILQTVQCIESIPYYYNNY